MSQRRSIEVRDLVVRYGTVAAVRGVTLQRRRRRAPHAARALGLRQDDHAAGDRRARAADVGRDPDRRRPVFSSSPRVNVPAERRGPLDGLPVLRDLAAHDACSTTWPTACACASGRRPRSQTRVREALDLVQLGDLGAPQRVEAVGRPAAARGAGPRLRVLALRAPLRRAAVEPRRQAARRDARRAQGAAAPARTSPRCTSPTTSRRRWPSPTASW